MDNTVILLLILGVIGPAIIFFIKLCLFTVAAAVVCNAISPTVVVQKKEETYNENENR